MQSPSAGAFLIHWRGVGDHMEFVSFLAEFGVPQHHFYGRGILQPEVFVPAGEHVFESGTQPAEGV